MSYDPIENGTITSPQGFSAGATFVNIKAWQEKPFDLGVLYSEDPCAVGGVFTTNKIKAAPVLVCQAHLKNGEAQALIANSGCANACTAQRGLDDAEQMAVLAAAKLGISSEDVMVASTGVIGTYLPMEKISKGIVQIELKPDGGHDLAQAIMTTDTVPKEVAVACEVDGEEVIIGGIAKGAGMIHPDMATMLCFLATDAAVDPDFLQAALRKAIDISFNMISVDGDTSTNDTAIIFANGAAGNETLHKDHIDAGAFQLALNEACITLAKAIARDGEGATKLIEMVVEGAVSDEEARMVARTIVTSSLVKTAVYGADPNWGRVIAAAGRSGADIREDKIDLYLDNVPLMRKGRPVVIDAEAASKLMQGKDICFHLCLNLGQGMATGWGCDFTEEYIALNGDYTT